ncbi:CheR family methyltransferase [Labrys neptuniae]
MSMLRFEQYLERVMGLKAVSIGASAIERAVAARCKVRGLVDLDTYWGLLQASSEEVQELIEAVIVPETWFFRDPQAFRALARLVTERLSGAQGTRPLRLLSLPCSSGEEPYTIAMALLDAGLNSDQFQIDAVDLSTRMLALAKLGIYGKNSFRSQNLAFRDRHFTATKDGYRIHDAVRARVQFRHGNIIASDFYPDSLSYDFIFCRNLLIYFDALVQRQTLAVLRRLLEPEGVAFVGHSEAGLMPANGFASAKIPMAFAFHKTGARTLAPKATPLPPLPPAKHQRLPVRPSRLRAVPPAPRVEPSKPQSQPQPQPSLTIEDLRRLADRGQLAEAARGCEALIRDSGATPDLLMLLGLVRDASGDGAGAEANYRKALYLDPFNAEALGHLALVLRKQGDQAGARLLEERLRRLDERRAR